MAKHHFIYLCEDRKLINLFHLAMVEFSDASKDSMTLTLSTGEKIFVSNGLDGFFELEESSDEPICFFHEIYNRPEVNREN